MTYIALGKNLNIILHDSLTHEEIESHLGDLLFSFLELNLEEYRNLYSFIGCAEDFCRDDFRELCQTYPKTYTKMQECGYEPPDDEKDTLLDFALQFLLYNEDTFSDLYKHPFFSFSSALLLGGSSYYSVYPDINFYNFQQKIKDLIDFCYISDNAKLSKLNKISRFFLFAASTPGFDLLFETKKTFFPSPHGLYREINSISLETLYAQGHTNYNAWDLLPLLNDSIIDEVNARAKLLSVGSCDTVFDFLAFEFETILSKDIDIKRCANCGKLFIPSGKYNTDCCDRIPEGEKYSCKKIMAQKRRKQKVNSDPITKEYEKAYKRMYARISSGTLEKSDFLKWSEDAKQKRDASSQRYAKSKDETIIIDFKKYLGNK